MRTDGCLLCIDRIARPVVVELKRTEDSARVVGLLFLLGPPVALVTYWWGAAVGTSWGLYAFWRLGYWHLVDRAAGGLLDPPDRLSLDSFVISFLLLGAVVVGAFS